MVPIYKWAENKILKKLPLKCLQLNKLMMAICYYMHFAAKQTVWRYDGYTYAGETAQQNTPLTNN